MSLCVYVCVRACMRVNECAPGYVCACVHHVCAREYVYVCACAREYVYVCACAREYEYVCVCVCSCVYVHVRACVYAQIRLNESLWVWTCVCLHACVFIIITCIAYKDDPRQTHSLRIHSSRHSRIPIFGIALNFGYFIWK